MASTTTWGFNKKVSINYDRKGKLNSESFPFFKRICRMDQAKLKLFLELKLKVYYKEEDVISEDGYIYVRGTNSNVLLTAHMDTVHKENCKDIYTLYDKKNKRHILSSPQGIGGDDRCGIYAIMQILDTTDFRPYIIFCEDEEVGGIGSQKFGFNKELVNEVSRNVSFMVEIDRANANDAVFYEEENRKFMNYVMDITGNKEAFGSFSDICHLSEQTDVSSFNISCGYYNAHTTSEYVVMEELESCIDKIIKLIETNQDDQMVFEYESYFSHNRLYNYNYGYNDVAFEFIFSRNGEEMHEYYEGKSLEACVGTFMMDNPDLKWGDVIDYQQFM